MPRWESSSVVGWVTPSFMAERLAADPMWLFRVWEGGMAFHGGLLGVLVAMAVFARQRALIGALNGFCRALTPVGLALGRLGNFIGQELWGRPAEVPWAMVFRMTRSVWLVTPRSSISLLWRGACCFHLALVQPEAAADLGSIRRLPDGLRCAAILCRIFPRARCAHRF
ncbi:MAG: hypothetical protein CM15mP74_11910 [Halieaceae bacterium]|nr:MAG: hypothetical protein CM15mP74_11910 [Halieaceae bacterium]